TKAVVAKAARDSEGSMPPPAARPGASGGSLAAVRQRYDEAVERYRFSFGDSPEAQKALADARAKLIAARDALASAGDVPGADDLSVEISRLLYDCNKRSVIH